MIIENVIATIDEIATTHGDHVAYDELGVTHSYSDLKQASDRIAAYITNHHLATGAPIMIYGGQQFEMIASFLGSVKSGHAYVPVDVNSADERLIDIIEIGQPALVIAVDDLPIEITDVPVVTPAQLAEILATPVDFSLTQPVSGDDNFYIIFTSGTTGKPKGVQISHTNLLSFANWMLGDDFAWQTGSNVLSQPPYSFDLSVMDWVPTLLSKGTLKALPKATADDFKTLFQTLPTLALNKWVSTPSFADVALLDPEFTQVNHPNLDTFLFCGEVLTKTTAEKLLARFPKAKIFNTYGPTEATVAVTGLPITNDIIANYDKMPIGYANADTQIIIQDPDGVVLPDGQAGEIVIAGPSVSKGYLNNPEKTASAFTTVDGQQAYRTGDLATRDADGLLHYKGRSDFQIKLHGFRIELEEVAQQLQQSQWVEQAVAVPRYDADGKVKQLLAILVAKENDFDKPILLTNAIKAELENIMMPYMMPGRFMYRESMPLTPNGKIDLKGLIAEVNGNA
ncbi:D-alanine--poly(phosphoribitol) ligase subunit DltA [Leuconostoc holzapfelii]|uniref:D-alanine--D-alanyl carrier protein ligase n=1 Tax=Leuconostoc holzapfelii TaxID=434464 RepID=A0A846ZG58_9LACO|nr:D-alanine--poly(phosphoribitol) ligase subunit DltA [Leuconostoc holzapfelii]NKZ18221.1 D-alanine--poly(phosphoribitol) ligase subunit DltA [Leuconostoc holzapfelii]